MRSKRVLIAAKEETISLATRVYEILEEEHRFRCYIVLLTPLDEILLKRQVNTLRQQKRVMGCKDHVFSRLRAGDAISRLREASEETYEVIAKEILTHPTMLYDKNRRRQYRSADGNVLKETLSACALGMFENIEYTKPDLVIDFSIYDISRSILASVCREMDVTYRTIVGSRFEDYWFRTDALGDDVVSSALERLERCEDSKIRERSVELVNTYKQRNTIMPEREDSWLIKKFSIVESVSILKEVMVRAVVCIERITYTTIEKHRYKIAWKQMNAMVGPLLETFVYSTFGRLRRLERIWMKPMNLHLDDSRYVYFPMPNTVENGDVRFNNGFISEFQVLDICRLYLDKVRLVAKDHRSMIIDRTRRQVDEIKRIYGVTYCSEWTHSEGRVAAKYLIENAKMTIAISGTTGLECALLGKKCVVLGNPIYKRYFQAVGFRYQKLEDALSSVEDVSLDNEAIVPSSVVLSYVDACQAYGQSFRYYKCLEKPYAENNQQDIRDFCRYMVGSDERMS